MPIPLGILAIAGAGAGGANFIGKISGASTDWGYSVKADASGNFYVGGYTTISSKDEFFIAKYDTTGAIQWQRTLGDAYDNTIYDLDIDSSGNVYVTGRSDRTGSFEYNFQIAKYNTSGTIQWQRRLGGTSNYDEAKGIAIDSSGDVYVVGYSDATLNGFNGVFVAKYNSSGTIQWQRRLFTGSVSNFGLAVDTDSSNNVYVAGRADDGAGDYDFLIAKWNSSGSFQWSRRLGNTNTWQIAYGIVANSSGDSYVVGFGEFGFDGYDFLMAKYNTSGTIQWQRRLGGTGGQNAEKITMDSLENIYVIGTNDAAGYGEVQVAKYNSSGTIQWQRKLGVASSTNQGWGISVDSLNDFYFTGRSINANSDILFGKLPQDGSKTGTFSLDGQSFVYQATTLTDASTSLTAQTITLTENASSLTDASTSLTDAAGTLTSTTTNF